MPTTRALVSLSAASLAALAWAGCDSADPAAPGCTPATELCNGLDDDCDGAVDEALGELTCGVGICAAAVPACAGGVPQTCTPGPADPPEGCDGVDDDCDGTVDEGCACVDGATQGCYGGPAWTLNVGACRAGTQTCAGGAWGACEGEQTPVAETCNGADDDCDGAIDDGIGAPACPLQQGVCAGATAVCGVSGWECSQESYGPSWEQDETMCDGLDNDCDGQADEGLRQTFYRDADFDGWGAAPAQLCFQLAGYSRTPGDCDDTRSAVHPGAIEACDGLDNDCDAVTDEGCP